MALDDCGVPADVAGRTFSRLCCVFSGPEPIGCESGDGDVIRLEASTEFVLEEVRYDGVGAVLGRCCALVPVLLEESCRAEDGRLAPAELPEDLLSLLSCLW